MKNQIIKSSVVLPSLFLLTLVLSTSSSSCSQGNLGEIVREHIRAVNTDDIEKNLALFTDDAVFEIGDSKIIGKVQLRGLMESDVVNKTRLAIKDLNVEGDTVVARLMENNESQRLLGIEESPQIAAYKFRGHLLERVKLEFPPESEKLWDEKFKPYAEWAIREHPQEFKREEAGGYTAENARLFLSLLREWREKTKK
jgi:hypothetical protein